MEGLWTCGRTMELIILPPKCCIDPSRHSCSASPSLWNLSGVPCGINNYWLQSMKSKVLWKQKNRATLLVAQLQYLAEQLLKHDPTQKSARLGWEVSSTAEQWLAQPFPWLYLPDTHPSSFPFPGLAKRKIDLIKACSHWCGLISCIYSFSYPFNTYIDYLLRLGSVLDLCTKAEGLSLSLSCMNMSRAVCTPIWAIERTRGAGSSGDFALEPLRNLGNGAGEEAGEALTSVSSLDLVASGLDFNNIIYFVYYISATYTYSVTQISVNIVCKMNVWFSVTSERSFLVRYHGQEALLFMAYLCIWYLEQITFSSA